MIRRSSDIKIHSGVLFFVPTQNTLTSTLKNTHNKQTDKTN